MKISKVEFTYKKANLRYDADLKKWIGYRVDVRSQGKRYRTTFRTRAEADRFVNDLRSEKVYSGAGLVSPVPNRIPKVSELFTERLKEIKVHAAHIRAKRVFEYFQALLDFDQPITAIRKSHFKQFIRRRESDGVKAETINREINELSAAFNRASDIFPRQLEEFEPNVARPRVRRGKRPHREITEAEVAAIVNTILTQRTRHELTSRTINRPTIARMFELAWILGLRYGEVEKLRAQDYNAREKTLRVQRWKTGDVTLFKFLPDQAIEIINAAIRSSNSDHPFEIIGSREIVRKTLRDACLENGIPYGQGENDSITFHSTRHSFVSRLVRVTDLATAQSFTSHSSPEMLDHYAHASEQSQKQAMEAMYGSAKTTEKLRQIYDQVLAGKMSFEEFLERIK